MTPAPSPALRTPSPIGWDGNRVRVSLLSRLDRLDCFTNDLEHNRTLCLRDGVFTPPDDSRSANGLTHLKLQNNPWGKNTIAPGRGSGLYAAMMTGACPANATATQTGLIAGRHAPDSNGRWFTLGDIVEHFNVGGQYRLTTSEQQGLLAFLPACNGRTGPMSTQSPFTLKQAIVIGEQLGIRWETFAPEQFRAGLAVELEHGTVNPTTNVTNDDPLMTGKIAFAHLAEFPDYYTRLATMEAEAKRFWSQRR